MRTYTVEHTVYTWDELTDKAKKHALEELWDINVDCEWWDWTYEDAENIGLNITEFDLDHGTIDGNLTDSALSTANKIMAEHGKDCKTYVTAMGYLHDYAILIEQERLEWDAEKEGYEFDTDEADTDDIDREFLRSLLEDYRILLQREYGYQTSEEAIIETILANEYEFDANGNLD